MLLGPALLVLAAVFIYPLIYSFYLSLTAYDIIMPPRFVGLQNYARILSDPNVWNSVRVSLIFTIGALTLEFLIGFGIALILHDIGFGRNWFRTISVIPIMLTPVVIGVVWRMMTNYDFGIFNYFVTLAGFERVGWSVDVHTALPLLIVSDIWHTTGFVVLVLSAGLAQLPEDLFEAAEIDGASAWRRLVNITIPLLQPVFLVVFVFRSYELLRMFDKAVTLTQGGPARHGNDHLSRLSTHVCGIPSRVQCRSGLPIIGADVDDCAAFLAQDLIARHRRLSIARWLSVARASTSSATGRHLAILIGLSHDHTDQQKRTTNATADDLLDPPPSPSCEAYRTIRRPALLVATDALPNLLDASLVAQDPRRCLCDAAQVVFCTYFSQL
ncbi:MAG: sugar ABC transporter permease [Caldilineaceae bacterium]